MTPRRTLLALGAATLALAACGGDDDATDATATTAAAADGDTTVVIDEGRFQTGEIVVASGSSVVFANEDMGAHTVATRDDQAIFFESEVLPSGTAYTTPALDEPGTYDYFCTLHPTMQGTIIVEG